MSKFTGLGELRTVADLVCKLRHDLDRMEKDPGNHYAAFDFFVTANSAVDWLYPDAAKIGDNKSRRDSFRENDVRTRIAAHLADGSKHFRALAKVHKSVAATETARYVEGGYVSDGYFCDHLEIHLSQSEVKALGSSMVGISSDEVQNLKSMKIAAISLAKEVLKLWEAELKSSPRTS